jgi:methylglutaconyl-CoA hydratase
MTKAKSTHTDSFTPPIGGAGGGSYRYIEFKTEGQVARITLNRPERHNALILELISELDQALDEVSGMNEILFVVLSGNGRSFCAGADLNWFYSSELLSLEQHTERYKHLADLLLKIYQLPQITIATVRGNVFGGGIGLMAACDFVLAEENTRFVFSEVKLGLLPATILPFVCKRLSVQYLRKWILPGTLFLVPEANQAGLVDLVFQEEKLETSLAGLMASFDAASPLAVKSAKQLINRVAAGEINVSDTNLTARILAEALLSPDGQEGIHAFLEKRKPEWSPTQTLPGGEGLKKHTE